MRAILISPERRALAPIGALLTQGGWRVCAARSVAEARAQVDCVDFVVVDLDGEAHAPLALFDSLVSHRPFVAALAVTRNRNGETPIEIGSRLGVLVLARPIDAQALAHTASEVAILRLIRRRSVVGLDAIALRGRLRNVLHMLRESDGNRSAAATRLGVGRTTLVGFIRTYGVTIDDWRQ